ncbi:MAG TPA: ABC transporter permease [Candidatus Angelobacter sp.]|nr:ABC transporter permease [Candidatus Angelobacter sp.]
MSRIAESWRKLQFLLRRRQMDKELAEEMRLHAELKAQKNIAAGMQPDEAQMAARRQLGNTTLQQEHSRANWGFPRLESLVQDVRYGLRGLRNRPGFSAVAILTLALGIGSATAIFSVVNAIILRPLPYKNSQHLVHLWSLNTAFPEFHMGMSLPNLDEVKAQTHSFEAFAPYKTKRGTLTGEGAPERVVISSVSSDFFSVFSARPLLGRTFEPADDQQKNGDVVVLSHTLWRRRFASDPHILGRVIHLDQKARTVVGVMPAGFTFPETSEAWTTLTPSAEELRNRTQWMFFTVARLRPAVSPAAAQSELNTLAEAMKTRYAEDMAGTNFLLTTLHDDAVGSSRSQLLVLLAAVGFLLLIACANVSNLVLARGLQRRHEIAVRAALGASRSRVMRQLGIENLVLALAGGAVGLVLAAYGVSAFRQLAPADFPRLDELRIEPLMAIFALLISTTSGVLFGLAPALTVSRTDPGTAMKPRGIENPTHARGFSLRDALVVIELALAMLLLTGSALMVQSMSRLLKVDTGLRTDHLVTAELNLPPARYSSENSQVAFIRQLLESLAAQGPISDIAVSNNAVLDQNTSLISFDPSLNGSNEKKTNLESKMVSPGYFSTLGLHLINGRFFDEHDTKGASIMIIVNQSLANRFFPGQNLVGRSLRFSGEGKDQYTVVGVVSDSRDIHVSAKPRPEVYFSLLQDPSRSLYVMVRSRLEMPAVRALLEKSVWAVDKDQPVSKVRTMAEVIAESVADRRFRTWLMSAFAVFGLSLTLIGIYCVISYSVSQRTHEMGIRMAIGASRENVLGLVLSSGARLAAFGALTGLVASFLMMRVLSNQLYDIKPNDPLTLIGTALLLLLVALLASYVPARRATRVDPMVALRYE